MVAIHHPAWDRSCEACVKYLPKEDGTYLRDRLTLQLLERTREPTPCHKCPKVPLAVRTSGVACEVMRESACDLTDRDRKAWAFYRKCRAVGRFPEDPVVEWYSEILRAVYDEADREPARKVAAGLEALAAALAKRGR